MRQNVNNDGIWNPPIYRQRPSYCTFVISSNYKLLRTASTKTAASRSALTVETNLFDSVVIAIISPEPCRSLERLSIICACLITTPTRNLLRMITINIQTRAKRRVWLIIWIPTNKLNNLSCWVPHPTLKLPKLNTKRRLRLTARIFIHTLIRAAFYII